MTESPKQASGRVYLVGAGPGDPGLITARGLACLRRAEVVIYDYLANPVFLDEAPVDAERIYVGKTCGCHHTPQEHINALLLDHARAGRTVVRLKGGDPFIFGRGGEEASLLHEAGIPFEVVPGVTAGFAAAAYAGIPLTHRDFTTSLGLFTGHEKPEKKLSSLDWDKIATGLGTLVFYMGMTNLPVICEKMMAHGRAPETPVAVIRWATTPRQQVVEGTLETIVDDVARVGLKPPAVIVVGEVVGLRRQLRWFEDRPLLGKRILVTRSASAGSEFARLLEQRGAEAVLCPVIRFADPEDCAPLDQALRHLAEYDDLILTSANAVERFFARLGYLGLDVRALGGLRLVAVGPKTAESLRGYHLNADIVPVDSRAEGVVAELTSLGVAGRRILYPRAQLARSVIPDQLSAAGARVDAPVLYRTLPDPEGAGRLAQALKQGLDAVTFTASSTVTNLIELADADQRRQLAQLPLFSIGPETSRTMRRLGLEVAAQAATSTLEGMVEKVVEFFQNSAKG
ncbi:MAG: uroporphyrinogen-III C-methyltransferase [Deltaproteobacteria bacterium]|nr:MAG: uroporphyrinogen-III C-methyltransferase [Deltaproteobacteria bacterium]